MSGGVTHTRISYPAEGAQSKNPNQDLSKLFGDDENLDEIFESDDETDAAEA